MPTKIKFADLTDESKILKITIPIFTPVTKNPDDETDEQIMNRHEKFLSLPETVKDKIACEKISKIIQQIGTVYKLELLQLADISRAIRSYYFGELKLEDFAFVLAREMNIDLARANQIFQIVKERIIDDNSYEKAAQADLVSIPLSEALRIYPEVGEQLITSSKINLRNFPYPVRPSIKNWIADYTFNLGYEKHESMERSNYLFQGPNTKNLPALEKNKLAYLLKSFDENSPITVNKTTKQIIFTLGEAAPAPMHPTVAPQAEQKNINSMQFSYRQKLPYEKTIAPAAPIKSLPQNFSNSPRNFQSSSREIQTEYRGAEHISQNKPNPWKLPEKSATPQNLPKNVVDLKNIQG